MGINQICYITAVTHLSPFFYLIWLGRMPTFVHFSFYWPGLDGTVRRPIQCGPVSLPLFVAVCPTWWWWTSSSSDRVFRTVQREGSKWIQMIPLLVPLIRRVISLSLLLACTACSISAFLVTFLGSLVKWLSTCPFNSDNFFFRFFLFSVCHHSFFLFSISFTFLCSLGSLSEESVCVCVRAREGGSKYLFSL